MSNFADFGKRLFARVPALSPRQPADAALSTEIFQAGLFDGARGPMVEACRAGLLLFNDDLDRAHGIAQNDSSQTGSFWHAIIHRREGDFSNARYWWRMTGEHPAFEEIYDVVLHRVPDFGFLDELRAAEQWDPVLFTAWCQKAQTPDEVARLESVQVQEMRTLLNWCASRVAPGK